MTEQIEHAINQGELDEAKRLILESARRSRTVVGLPEESGLSPLHVAAFHDAEAAESMVKMGLEPDLHTASALGLTEVVRQLAERDPSALNAELEYLTPLAVAILKGQTETVWCLLQCGDDPNRHMRRINWFLWEVQAIEIGWATWRPVHMAAMHGYNQEMGDILNLLVEAGADLSPTSSLGKQAIHLSATANWVRHVDLLLDLGADIEARSMPIVEGLHALSHTPVREIPHAHDLTPLMVAIKEGHLEASTLLAEKGADIEAKDSNGWASLHHAALPWWEENVEIVRMLVRAGADRTVKDDFGHTPALLARNAGYLDTAKLLAE